jgi:hypothetical protein
VPPWADWPLSPSLSRARYPLSPPPIPHHPLSPGPNPPRRAFHGPSSRQKESKVATGGEERGALVIERTGGGRGGEKNISGKMEERGNMRGRGHECHKRPKRGDALTVNIFSAREIGDFTALVLRFRTRSFSLGDWRLLSQLEALYLVRGHPIFSSTRTTKHVFSPKLRISKAGHL